MAPLRREHRHADQTFHAPEACGALDDLQTIVELRRAFVAAVEIEAHHAAEAAHLPRRDRVVGMRRQTRIVDRADASIAREKRRDRLGARVVALDAKRQRLESAAECVRWMRIHHRADHPPDFFDRRDEGRRPGHDAAGHVAVAVQILRRALHREVDTQRQRLLIDWARERVVDDR